MLSLRLFDAARDAEAARYRILAEVAATRAAFRSFRVSPWLSELVLLHRELSALVEGAASVERSAGAVVGVDWATGQLVRDGAGAPLAVGLARWALPHLEAAAAEGRALYEFVAEHAALEPVGFVPAYHDEGVLIVAEGSDVRALRYQVSPLAGLDGAYRALRTRPLDVALDPLAPPHAWKAAASAAAPDLGVPATFCLEADVDLPLEPTLVPIAKRKLLGLVGTWGEA